MKKIRIASLDLWQFENLKNEPAIRHFVSDRNSNSNEKEFTIGFSSLPDKAKVQGNRDLLAIAIGVNPSHLYFPSQVHKTKITHVTRGTSNDELLETDALITNENGMGIAVMSADCVPILLYDKKNRAIGAVHSGWRGTVAKILEKTLSQMQERFGTTGEDLFAGIGPSVCQDSYEVGEEVVREVDRSFGLASGLMIRKNEKAHVDLWKANKIQLREFGVPASQIEISDLCTIKNNDHFFSARKGDVGRFAAGIVLINEAS